MQHGFPCKLAGKNSEGNPLKLDRILWIWIEEYLKFEFNYKGNSLNVNKSERNFWVWMEFCRDYFNILFKLNRLFWRGSLNISGCLPEDSFTSAAVHPKIGQPWVLICSSVHYTNWFSLLALGPYATELRLSGSSAKITRIPKNKWIVNYRHYHSSPDSKQSYSTGELHMSFLTLGFFWDTET